MLHFKTTTRPGVDKVKPRYGLSTPYRLTMFFSTWETCFFVLPALVLSILAF